jgi:hypothetical protein
VEWYKYNYEQGEISVSKLGIGETGVKRQFARLLTRLAD